MRVLASYILKGPIQAMLSAAVPAAISVSAPFLVKLILVYFCGVAVALVSLRLGARKGLSVLAAAIVAAVLTGQWLQLGQHARLDLWNAVYLWSVLWLAASVLQYGRSLALSLKVVLLLAIVTNVMFFIVIDEPLQWGQRLLEPMASLLSEPGSGLSSEEVGVMMLSAASILPGSVIAYSALGVIVCLLIARSWQARLFNPGGLQQEFRAIRLDRYSGVLTLALIAALLFGGGLDQTPGLLVINISIVVGLVFVIFGLGVAHGVLAQRENAGFWIVGLYALLILLSQIVAPLLMVVALTDIWVDYRARFARKTG